MRIFEAIVKGLESLGVDTAFGGTGENNASLLLALKASKKINTVIVRHEQAAAFMACGYAMYSNRLGVCFATAGPGAFNLFSGMAVALTDSLPVLAISGYSSLDWKGKGALNETTGLNRMPDSQTMFAATTKSTFLIEDVSQTCDILEKAVNIAFEGRPGPVHIHVPTNLTDPSVKVENYRDPHLNLKRVLPEPAQVASAAEALALALGQKKRVLVIIGFGAFLSNAKKELLELLEGLQVPFVTTLGGKGIIPEDHPLSLGILANSGNVSATTFFKGTELVLAIGNSFSQNATFDFFPGLFQNKKLIHINIDKNEISKVYKADHGIVAEAAPAIKALFERTKAALGPIAKANFPKDGHQSVAIAHTGKRIHPGQLAQSLSKLLPDDSILLADAGSHLAWMAYYTELSRGQRYHKPGTFGPMACHVNGALGVKCAFPNRTVVVGCGDGCYLLSGFELLTAVQHKIPAIWIIFNDGLFNIIKFSQMAIFHETAFVDFKNPDYVAFAKACGTDGFQVETLEAFESAFKQALASGKPTIIDALIEPNALPSYQFKP